MAVHDVPTRTHATGPKVECDAETAETIIKRRRNELLM
jgi:hypothetical protein